MQFVFRFLIGGLVVCAFASLADVLKPKTFAGIFGAAPSVALATLALTVSQEGQRFAADEARSMIAGAAAFVAYAFTCRQFLTRWCWNPLGASTASLAVWLACAFALWLLLLR